MKKMMYVMKSCLSGGQQDLEMVGLTLFTKSILDESFTKEPPVLKSLKSPSQSPKAWYIKYGWCIKLEIQKGSI